MRLFCQAVQFVKGRLWWLSDIMVSDYSQSSINDFNNFEYFTSASDTAQPIRFQNQNCLFFKGEFHYFLKISA